MSKVELALNPNTSIETLVELSNDKEWIVRGGVAENSNTSTEILIKLSKDDNEDIRLNVAENPTWVNSNEKGRMYKLKETYRCILADQNEILDILNVFVAELNICLTDSDWNVICERSKHSNEYVLIKENHRNGSSKGIVSFSTSSTGTYPISAHVIVGSKTYSGHKVGYTADTKHDLKFCLSELCEDKAFVFMLFS